MCRTGVIGVSDTNACQRPWHA